MVFLQPVKQMSIFRAWPSAKGVIKHSWNGFSMVLTAMKFLIKLERPYLWYPNYWIILAVLLTVASTKRTKKIINYLKKLFLAMTPTSLFSSAAQAVASSGLRSISPLRSAFRIPEHLFLKSNFWKQIQPSVAACWATAEWFWFSAKIFINMVAFLFLQSVPLIPKQSRIFTEMRYWR